MACKMLSVWFFVFGLFTIAASAVRAESPPDDSDHDGMPDRWEVKHGFSPKDATDGPEDADEDEYTNVEEFLNGTNPAKQDAARGKS